MSYSTPPPSSGNIAAQAQSSSSSSSSSAVPAQPAAPAVPDFTAQIARLFVLMEEQRKKAEADLKAAEERRVADLKAADEQRSADLKAVDEQRSADLKAAEERRVADSKADAVYRKKADAELKQTRAEVEKLKAQAEVLRAYLESATPPGTHIAVKAGTTTHLVAVYLQEGHQNKNFDLIIDLLKEANFIAFETRPTFPSTTDPKKLPMRILRLAASLLHNKFKITRRNTFTPPTDFQNRMKTATMKSNQKLRDVMELSLRSIMHGGDIQMARNRAAHEISFRNFYTIALYELRKTRPTADVVGERWNNIDKLVTKLHGFGLKDLEAKLGSNTIDDVELFLYNSSGGQFPDEGVTASAHVQ